MGKIPGYKICICSDRATRCVLAGCYYTQNNWFLYNEVLFIFTEASDPFSMNCPNTSWDNNSQYVGDSFTSYQGYLESNAIQSYGNFNSSSNDYVPQGQTFFDSLLPTEPDDRHTTSNRAKSFQHELPSAARKTFAPLHNNQDEMSDPGIFLKTCYEIANFWWSIFFRRIWWWRKTPRTAQEKGSRSTSKARKRKEAKSEKDGKIMGIHSQFVAGS